MGQHPRIETFNYKLSGWVNIPEYWVNIKQNGGSAWNRIYIAEIIKKVVNPEMIILFGSYAKGTFVEHRYVSKGITYEYISDYDFLVVTRNNPEKSYVQESRVMDLAERFKPPVNLEIHEIDYINKGLEWGEYFWVDIIKEGISLYDKGTVQFAEPRELTNAEKKEKAQQYFDTWFPQATHFVDLTKYSGSIKFFV